MYAAFEPELSYKLFLSLHITEVGEVGLEQNLIR